jgi:hypothetical protein
MTFIGGSGSGGNIAAQTISVPNTAPGQNPDTGQITFASMFVGTAFAGATVFTLMAVWFNFITDATAGNRDWAIEVRSPKLIPPGSSHNYLMNHTVGQAASLNRIYTFAGFGSPWQGVGGAEVLAGVIPIIPLPGSSTFELDSTGPVGATGDQFINITLTVLPGG